MYSGFILVVLCLSSFSQTPDALEYAGCYADGPNRTFPISTIDRGTLEKCQSFCLGNALHTYFASEAGDQCNCGEDFSSDGKRPESECDQVCRDDAGQICGGSWRLSVYYVCPRGYFGQNCTQKCYCKDKEYCSRRGTCLNQQCAQGWEDRTCSIDVNECKNKTVCAHNCHNTVGSYYCSCRGGFKLLADNITCSDTNECATNNGKCSHTCTNTEGSFVCSCPSDLKLRSDQRTCTNDTNECATNKGGCSHTCTNTEGSFVCSCPSGLKLGSDRRTCIKPNDTNECATNNGGCSHNCTDTEKSYYCSCPNDRKLDGDMRTCTYEAEPSASVLKIVCIILGCVLGCAVLVGLLIYLIKRFRSNRRAIRNPKRPVVENRTNDSRNVELSGRLMQDRNVPPEDNSYTPLKVEPSSSRQLRAAEGKETRQPLSRVDNEYDEIPGGGSKNKTTPIYKRDSNNHKNKL